MVADLIAQYGHGRKLPDIAKSAGLGYERVRNIAYGRVKSVTDDEASQIARALGVPVVPKDISTIATKPMARLQVVGAASAGHGLSDHPDEYFVYVPQSMTQEGSRGWVVEGDSTSPWLLPGDVVIVAPHKGPRLNYPMLVRNQDGETMVKIIKQSSCGMILSSVNESYADVPAIVE